MKRIVPMLVMLLGLSLAAPAASDAQICGSQSTHPKTYDHVVWIWMENHSYTQIIGSPDAPYINSLATSCGLAANFHNITHVSLPNYVGAVTGLALKDLQQFLFDCSPGGACLTPADSIFSQTSSWKAYMESMTSNCQSSGFVGYAVRHNPPPYLTSLVSCSDRDVPYPQLQHDLDANQLPLFSFISPNTVNDMHDGADPGAIVNGDTWLQNELPKILNSVPYQSGKTVVFVTFDEGEFGPGFSIGENCARNTTDESCHIPTIVISPYTRPGTVSHRLYNHYSLLRTTESLIGLSKFLGRARGAAGMRRQFNL